MPCEFSLAHYRDTLNMDPHLFGRAKDRPKIILAHDVDLFPPYALAMAKVEHSLGVRATYFILQHSEFYNAMSPENMEIWKEIRKMGHEIGLHYNGEYSPDLSIAHFAFAKMFNADSIELALHLNGLTPQPEIPPYLHDRREFASEGYAYIADSGGWWRDRCICQHLHEKLLFVCHPIWWNTGADSLSPLTTDAISVLLSAKSKWDKLVRDHRLKGMAK